ncbi:hypothetical protein [Halodesulfovibrio aestuarii]|uniref:Uncharacterized protein n=1 Tax=Halodesulfovibrio aestuarii TaxID=126333 RepID=A0ABV4JS75_9BACT
MRKMISLCLSIVMALLVIGECRAEQYEVVEPNAVIAGSITVKGQNLYLDDGEYEFLLLNFEDISLEGMQVEVFGDYVTVNEKPAFKVTSIDVYEGGDLPSEVDTESDGKEGS